MRALNLPPRLELAASQLLIGAMEFVVVGQLEAARFFSLGFNGRALPTGIPHSGMSLSRASLFSHSLIRATTDFIEANTGCGCEVQ